jgi:Ras homolog gene family, member A
MRLSPPLPSLLTWLQWYPEVMHFCPTTPIILCGLKSDLRHKKTCIDLLKSQGLTPVTPEQGRAVAAKMGAVYMECSAKERIGIEEIFDQAIIMAVGEEQKEEIVVASGRTTGLSGGNSRRKKAKGCKFL